MDERNDKQIPKELKEAEEGYTKALEEESEAYQKMQRAIGAYDLARHRAVQKLKMFNNVLQAQRKASP